MFINLEHDHINMPLYLTQIYYPMYYPKYDNYNAIECSKVMDIPRDYDGVIGVPITFLDKYCPTQFKIVGEACHGSDNEWDLFKPIVNKKELYKRILIQKKIVN